jgi:hypothetical protein
MAPPKESCDIAWEDCPNEIDPESFGCVKREAGAGRGYLAH